MSRFNYSIRGEFNWNLLLMAIFFCDWWQVILCANHMWWLQDCSLSMKLKICQNLKKSFSKIARRGLQQLLFFLRKMRKCDKKVNSARQQLFSIRVLYALEKEMYLSQEMYVGKWLKGFHSQFTIRIHKKRNVYAFFWAHFEKAH